MSHSGLCVGGPLAGQRMSWEKQSFEVNQLSPRSLRTALEESIAECVTAHKYNWHHLGPFGIWINDGLSVNDALNDMAIAYSEKHNGRR